MKRLSKSRYTAFCQCPKNLWLNVFKSGEAIQDEALQARFEQGNKVGDLAMRLFGGFVEVTTKNPDGSLDLTTMVELTKQEMSRGTENICEASFALDGNYCAVDILRKNGDGWDIYEVKSSSYSMIHGKPSDIEHYAPDIAYQKWLLTKCDVKVINTYLVCLNSDYVRHGELDLQELFVVIDMKDLVDNEFLKVPARVQQALSVLDNEEPDIDLSMHCREPYACAFFDYCKRLHNVPSPSVFDVYGGMGRGGFTFVKKLDCYQRGLIAFEQLRGQSIGPIQNMQIESALTGKEFINPAGIRKFLNGLSYPLYFLDFETMQDAVPQYDNAKVYAQITFQYSLHIKPSETAPCAHKEYLAPSDGSDPRRALAEQLCKDIPKDVCTLAYNKQFECGRIRELACIESVVIPETVTEIPKNAYSGYSSLKSVTIPSSVRKIDPEAFFCENLVLEVAPDNPTYEMRGGHLVTKKDSVLVIGNPKEPIPNTVTEIGERAFLCSDELEEVIIPDSVKKIGDNAFCACANLTKIVIPDSVIEIGSGAFDECDSLTEIHLPASLRKLGMAFDNGPYEGRSIYVHFTDPAQCQVEVLDDDEESTGWPSNWNDWLYVPKGCLKAFEKAEPWCGFNTIKEY